MRARGRESSRAGALAVAICPPFPGFQAGSVAKHDRADFAQEFLRRSRAYRAAWAMAARSATPRNIAAAQEFGLVTFFDPDRPVRTAPAVWQLETASQIVALASVTPAVPGAAPMPNVAITAELLVAGRLHFIVDSGGIRHRFELDEQDQFGTLVILLGPRAGALRAAASDAARRLFLGLGTREVAAALRPSALQHRRLALLLQVLDAFLSGASLRDIGTSIVYPWMSGASALAWRASSERRRTQRLLAEALDLAAGGYRTLLKP